MTDTNAEINQPAMVQKEYLYEITNAIENHPRSQQTRIGPSEIGTPCTRRLLHKLNGDKEPERRGIPWLPTIGTAFHTWAADVFTNATANHYPGERPRYLVETKVNVGEINGIDVTGSSDLFDTETGTVVDHKLIGKTPMQDYRRKGMRREYKVQAHLYGRGFQRAGYEVNWVMIACLPRNEISLDTNYFWSEPYDEQVAIDALDRATKLSQLITAVGIDIAVTLYPPCEDTRLCPWCVTPTTPKPPATTTAALIAAANER